MDNTILDDGSLAQERKFELGIGSQVVAQAPMFPGNEIVEVKSGPGAEVWETHRSTIKRLYLDEDKTLNEVMASMQNDYGLKATIKMYKSRISKWALAKNCKAKGMKAIARKKLQRNDVGKASSFRTKGRQVEIEKLLRLSKRKCHRPIEGLVAKNKFPEPVTLSDIDYSMPGASTPPLSGNRAHLGSSAPIAVAEAEVIHSQNPRSRHQEAVDAGRDSSTAVRKQLLWMKDSLCRLSSPSKIFRSLEPPRHLLVPELVLSAIKTFLQGSFNGWSTDEDGYLVGRKPVICSTSGRYAIDTFHESCITATKLLEQRLFVEARQLLFKACEKSKDIVEEGHPKTIAIIFDIYFRLKYVGCGGFAIKVFEHLKSTATISSASTRTFCQFFERMLLLDQNDEEVYYTAWKCSEDILERHLEPFNWPWLLSRLNHIQRLSSKSCWQEAEMLLRSLFKKCGQICGKSDQRNLEVLYRLAGNLYKQGNLKESEEIGQHIVQCAKNSKKRGNFAYCTILALDIVSRAQRRQGNGDLAENSLKHCIDIAIQEYGEKDPLTIHYSLQLEEFLVGWGRQEEATALAAQRTRILGPPEIKELIE